MSDTVEKSKTTTSGRTSSGDPTGLVPEKLTLHGSRVQEPEVRTPYWIGTTDDCPRQTVHAGGFDFPRALGKLTDERGEPATGLLRGRIVQMTAEEVKLVKQRIAERVVRSGGARRDVLSIRGSVDRPYRPRAGDEPLAKFVYMIRLGSDLPYNWRELPPETMA